jgi:hypothetical protein
MPISIKIYGLFLSIVVSLMPFDGINEADDIPSIEREIQAEIVSAESDRLVIKLHYYHAHGSRIWALMDAYPESGDSHLLGIGYVEQPSSGTQITVSNCWERIPSTYERTAAGAYSANIHPLGVQIRNAIEKASLIEGDSFVMLNLQRKMFRWDYISRNGADIPFRFEIEKPKEWFKSGFILRLCVVDMLRLSEVYSIGDLTRLQHQVIAKFPAENQSTKSGSK